jgi:hypothetical protein
MAAAASAWLDRQAPAKGEESHPSGVRRIEDGNPRFRALVMAFADAVLEAGTLR